MRSKTSVSLRRASLLELLAASAGQFSPYAMAAEPTTAFAAVQEVLVPRAGGRKASRKDWRLVFKVTGMVSLVSWLGVTFSGRMLPFLGNAF